jgi:hypothetical protein
MGTTRRRSGARVARVFLFYDARRFNVGARGIGVGTMEGFAARGEEGQREGKKGLVRGFWRGWDSEQQREKRKRRRWLG